MANYVLVHGGNMTTDTWNRLSGSLDYPPGGLLGGRIWESTAAALAARHHRVFAPTLRDEYHTTLTGDIQQITKLIDQNELNKIILIGHSYGGMVITGVASALPDRIRHLVYVDAALPSPGQSLFDLLKLGLSGQDAGEPMLPDPSPPYIEKLSYDPARIALLPKTYIRGTKSEFQAVTRMAKDKIASAPEHWTYLELPSSHVPMADMPDKLLPILLNAAEDD